MSTNTGVYEYHVTSRPTAYMNTMPPNPLPAETTPNIRPIRCGGSTSTANAVIVTIHVNSANATTAISTTIARLLCACVTRNAPHGINTAHRNMSHLRASAGRNPRWINTPDAYPPTTPPMSAARYGTQPIRPTCSSDIPRTSVMYFGNQNRMNCHTGSVSARIARRQNTSCDTTFSHQRVGSTSAADWDVSPTESAVRASRRDGRYVSIHGTIQINPMTPPAMKAARQPCARVSHAISGGAIVAPIVAPAL